MGKGKSREHLAVSLFPFLSILACIIGVLTLMITALALGQISEKASNQTEIDRAEEFQKLQKEAAQLSPKLENIRMTLTRSKEVEIEAQRAMKQREDLESKLKATKAPQKTAAQLEAQAKQLKEKNEAMEKQRKELLARLTPMREAAAKIPDVEEGGRITVRPGGSGTNLKPVFVECGSKGIVIHQPPQAVAVLRAGMEKSEVFLKVLGRIASDENSTIVFLVRPSGIATYNQASLIARTNYARNGKLPLPGEGPIDLSLFRGK